MGKVSRRTGGLAGLTFLATTGLLGTYVGYPGLRRAHASTSCTVTLSTDTPSPNSPPVPADYVPGELRFCLHEIETAGGGSITFAPSANGTITLEEDLPSVALTSSLTITGNGQTSTVIDGFGDGIYDYDYSAFRFTGNADITVSELTITRAYTSSEGSALYVSGNGDVTISNATFRRNKAATSDSKGGAIYVGGDGRVVVSYSTFDANYSDDYGGAIMLDGNGTAVISDSTFTGNRAAGEGGGAIATQGDFELNIDSSEFINNRGWVGGAIYAYGSLSGTPSTYTELTVVNSTFRGNRSDRDGGAIYVREEVSLDVSGTTFDTNLSDREGGAVYVRRKSSVTFTNSTFSGNESRYSGGAFYASAADVAFTMDFVTVSGNVTTGPSSGAIHSRLGTGEITNSIVYSNAGGDVKAPVAALTASYSLFTSSSSVSPSVTGATLIFGEDPLLGALADNGGPTFTMLPAADSPVIGMADPSTSVTTDQRGFSRTTNGLADMGAVEVGGVAPEADLSQLPPSWFQATTRAQQDDPCPAGMVPSWAEWPNEGRGGWTCEWVTWWDPNKGSTGDWVTTPGFNVGRRPGQ